VKTACAARLCAPLPRTAPQVPNFSRPRGCGPLCVSRPSTGQISCIQDSPGPGIGAIGPDGRTSLRRCFDGNLARLLVGTTILSDFAACLAVGQPEARRSTRSTARRCRPVRLLSILYYHAGRLFGSARRVFESACRRATTRRWTAKVTQLCPRAASECASHGVDRDPLMDAGARYQHLPRRYPVRP